MGCCFSKKDSSPPSSISLPNGGVCSAKSPIPNRVAVKPLKLEIETLPAKSEIKEEKPITEKELQEGEIHENGKGKKEVFVIKHRKSHERSKNTDPADSPVSAAEEKSTDLNPNQEATEVRTSSYTKDEVDAILIQCGRLSRSNSAAKTRRYSGSKRSFDFDHNERNRGVDEEEADAEDGGEETEEWRMHRQRHRRTASPRERRRRTPSREREDLKSYRSGSRERANGGGGSRRVSRSPGRRSDINPNPNCVGVSGNTVNSGNSRPGKLVSVPATDKTSLAMDKSNNGEPSIKRITVKRNVGEASRTAASPRSQSPARAASNAGNNTQPAAPSLSRNSSRKAEQSPYRRNPLGEIDPNSLAYPPSKGEKTGSGNGNCNKKMNRDSEGRGLTKETGNFMGQKSNQGNNRTANQASNCRAASPSRMAKERQETAEVEPTKPQGISRSRSSRQSRDFDFSPEALLSNNNAAAVPPSQAPTSYTALLLEDIQNFHQKSVNVNVNVNASSSFALPPCVTKACSIVEAVADLNSTTKTGFTSSAVKKTDLMEPSFETYVTVKRGGSSLDDMEEQESSGSNSFTGSSCVIQRHGFSSSSWEPSSADSTDRWNSKSNSTKDRDRSPFGLERQEFDPLKKKSIGRRAAATTTASMLQK